MARKIESFGATDIGLVRRNNEDVFAQLPEEQFFILADGMGGHKAGEIAANETVVELCSIIKNIYDPSFTLETWLPILNKAISQTNAKIFQLSLDDKEKEGMGTTLCFALLVQHTLIIGNVGDSRVYRIRKGQMQQLSTDHSLKGDLMAKGELDERLASFFPFKNVITRAIGTHSFVEPEFHAEEILSEDIYFLCSDGLTDLLNDYAICQIVNEAPSLKKACAKLILEAKKSGGNDNITVLMFKIHSL